MAYKLKFTHPHFPEGHEFGISLLGRVKNGGELEVDEDTERSLVANSGKPLDEFFKDNIHVDVSGSSSLSPDELKSLTPEPEETTTEQNIEQNTNTNTNTNTEPQPEEEGEE